MNAPFLTLEDMIVAAAEGVRPAERITVSQAAERYHIVRNPGQHDGPFSLSKTPYLKEPMDTLTSTEFTGMVFIGPARTGKSAMAINWLCHTAITDPADMMLVHMSQHGARDWSQADLDKAIRNSPELRKRLVPGRQNDNVYDKRFLSGMRFTVTWPTINNLSGKTIPRSWMVDYDRMPLDVDKEGDPWTLTKKRSQTFKRHGMTAAETSPGHLVEDAQWEPSTPHEAPPCKGLLSVYNNESDRRRWYWRCPQCHAAFEPHRKLLKWPDSDDPVECSEQVVMVCPHDGFPMAPSFQYELNLGGRWVREGQIWIPDAREPLVGDPRRASVAGFWMFGPAAGFTDWKELVYKLKVAELDWRRNMSEEKLKTVINTDFGEPYTPKVMEMGRLPEQLKAQAKPWSERGTVPPGVGFLVTTIDVQAGGRPSFVCHTYGIGPGVSPEQIAAGELPPAADIWHVEMWKIRKSKRLDEDGHPKLIDPASYPEDWNCLIDDVILRTYPLSDGSGRHMSVKIVACDSGGAARSGHEKKADTQAAPKVSVTANAYEFWRRLRQDPEGRNLHLRFHLVKGAPSETAPEIHKTYPDAQQKDKFAIARGDVPVWLLNSNKLKDRVSNRLGRTEPGGRVNFPAWQDEDGKPIDIDWLYHQLTAEIRTAKGWENPARRRNEAFDLLYYCVGICLHPDIRLEAIDWSNPPTWAATDWDRNSLVFMPGEERPLAEGPRRDMAALARDLG